MSRERWIYDRETGDIVSAADYRARQEARAAAKSFDHGRPRNLKRGTYLWRGGRWVHVSKLRRAVTKAGGIQVISDIEPYRTAAADVAKGGKRVVIGSRSEHRDFLRRNGYTEVGNDFVAPRREELSRRDRAQDIKRSMAKLGLD